MKNIFLVLLFTIGFVACSGDSPDELNTEVPEVPKDSRPKFKIDKSIVYLDEYHGYADVFKPYYYQYSITQTNPNATVSQERLKEMEDSLNNIIELPDEVDKQHLFFLLNVGIEVNGELLDMILQLNVGEDDREKYISLGRDGLLDIWRKNKMSGHISQGGDGFYLRIRKTDDLHMLFQLDKNMNDNVDSHYFKLVGKNPSSDYGISYCWVYDRFNDRTYVDDEGNKYSTKLVVKTMEEVEGYDHSITSSPLFLTTEFVYELNVSYPIIQIYKNDEIWFEGRIWHYAEEFSEEDDGVYTIANFSANTKRDGTCWQLSYDWPGCSRFHIEKWDFAKPTDTDYFTVVETVNVRIVEDNKEGHKGTGSFDDGKGNIFSFN